MKSIRVYSTSMQVRTSVPMEAAPQPKLNIVSRRPMRTKQINTMHKRAYQTYSNLMKEQTERTGDSRVLNMAEYHDLIMNEQEVSRLQRINKFWARTNLVASVPIVSSFFSDTANNFVQTYAGMSPAWLIPGGIALWVSWILSLAHYGDVQAGKAMVHSQYKRLRETLDK